MARPQEQRKLLDVNGHTLRQEHKDQEEIYCEQCGIYWMIPNRPGIDTLHLTRGIQPDPPIEDKRLEYEAAVLTLEFMKI